MNKFINAAAVLKNTPVDVFVCPVNTQSVVHSLFISSMNDKDPIHITIQVYDASQGATYNLGYQLEVMPKTTLSYDKPINLEENDVLKIITDKIDEAHAFASILNVIPSSL
jgi:hypothetical protein